MLSFLPSDDNIDETYGVNVQFESDEEVSVEGFSGRIAPLRFQEL